MAEPAIRDLPKVMIVDHCLNNIREMQSINFAKLYKFEPYFVYYGDPVENLPNGVRQRDTLESVLKLAETKKVNGVITGRQRTAEGRTEVYGIDLARRMRLLEPDEVRKDTRKRMPIIMHGSEKRGITEDEKYVDEAWVRGCDFEYEQMQELLAKRQGADIQLKPRAHIVTHGLVYDHGAAKIFDRKPHVLITAMQQAASEEELSRYVKMLGKGVDGIMLGVKDSGEIDSTLRVAAQLKEKIKTDFLQCSVSIVWTGERLGLRTNAIPQELEKGAAEIGVRVVGKHEMGAEAARVEQAKTGMPKHAVFLRRNEGGAWRDM